MFEISDGRDYFYQWDMGQRLLCTDIKAGEEVHFVSCSNLSPLAEVAVAYAEGDAVYVDVPDIVFQNYGDLRVFRCNQEDDDTGYATEHQYFRVKPRKKPADYIYAEGAQLPNWAELGERIAALEEGGGLGGSAPGKDGVSCTHQWNGTVLTITSASGTTSADLKGEKGEKGEKGDTGAVGPQGIQGEPGADGLKGDKGDKGDTGPQGPQGEKGDTGATGPQGPQGDKGDTGATGPQGPQGDKGEKGDTGATGPQGPQGEKGDKGDTGATGAAGADGATAAQVIAALTKETWTFTLADGSAVDKVVPLV